MNRRTFFGKLMLFGEYSIIHGSSALLMPMESVTAEWDYIGFADKSAVSSNKSLLRFADYLEKNDKLSQVIDTEAFKTELSRGLYLKSTIPNGYGLGSSGALVAAVYDSFARDKSEDYAWLKGLFAKMENCFHGNSSGIDPLQCYVGKPFVMSPDKKLTVLNNNFISNDLHLFLVDTQTNGHTGPLVMYFEEQRRNERYLNRFQNDYVPCVSSCISNLVNSHTDAFFASMNQLSKLQIELLNPMIPASVKPLFESETISCRLATKILGSGGGGYMLGFTDNKETTQYLLSEMRYKAVWIK